MHLWLPQGWGVPLATRQWGSCASVWQTERVKGREGEKFTSLIPSLLSLRFFSGCQPVISGRASTVVIGGDREATGVPQFTREEWIGGSVVLSHPSSSRYSSSSLSTADPTPPLRPAIPQQVLDLNLQGQAYITAGMLEEAKDAFHEAVALLSSSTSRDTAPTAPGGDIGRESEGKREGEEDIYSDASGALVGSPFFVDADDSATAVSAAVLALLESSRAADPNVTTLLRSARHPLFSVSLHCVS